MPFIKITFSIFSPKDAKAFYLKPLKICTDDVWYSKVPIGHNTLRETIKRVCAEAGLGGKRTNHSLRATSATRMYQAGIDEQLITERTGESSYSFYLFCDCKLFRIFYHRFCKNYTLFTLDFHISCIYL